MKLCHIAAFCLLASFGCTHSTAPSGPALLLIEVEGDFRGEFVRVWVDGALMREDTATTNWTIGLAWSKSVAGLTSGVHAVRATVRDFAVIDSASILVTDTTTVLIDYDRVARLLKFTRFKGVILRD